MLVTSVSIGSGLLGSRDLVSCGLGHRVHGIGQRCNCRGMDVLMAFPAVLVLLATRPGSYKLGKAKLPNYHIPSSSGRPSPCLSPLFALALAYSVVATSSMADSGDRAWPWSAMQLQSDGYADGVSSWCDALDATGRGTYNFGRTM